MATILTQEALSGTWIRGFKPKASNYDDVWATLFSIGTSADVNLDTHNSDLVSAHGGVIHHDNRTALDNVSGVNTGDQTITLQGIVTGSGSGTFNTAITVNSVTLDRLETVPTQTILGRNTALTGNIEELNVDTVKSMLGISTIGYKTVKNTYLGDEALPLAAGTDNTAIGYRSLYTSNSGATTNTAIGSEAGYSNAIGDGNVFVGYRAGYSETGSNKLYIANSSTSAALIKGDFSTRTVDVYGSLNATGGVYTNGVKTVPETRTINGIPLSANVVISASSVSGLSNNVTINTYPVSSNPTLTYSDVNAVPDNATINGKFVDSNPILNSTDVSAVDKTFTINGFTLNGSSISLNANDVYADVVPNGFSYPEDIVITYSPTTRTFVLTPTVTTDYYLNGSNYTISTPVTSAPHANSTNSYFLFYNIDNNLGVSASPWSLDTDVPIAYVYYNAATSAALLFDERHPSSNFNNNGFSNSDHKYHHLVNGTQYVDGLQVADYSVAALTPTVAQMQYSIAKGRIVDEDIWITCESSAGSIYAVPDGGPYRVMYRSGAASGNQWVWDDTGTMGILPASGASTTIAWNQLNGSTWQRTEMVLTGTGNYVNYWLVAMPVLNTATGLPSKQIVAIMGQKTHATLADAQSESAATLDWGINPQEFVIFGKFTYLAKTSHGATSLYASIAQFTYVRSNSLNTIINGASPSDHQSLSNRTASGSHPAQAISVIGSGATSAANTVQEAITTLSSAVASAGGSVTVSATYTPNPEYVAFTSQTNGTATSLNVSPSAAYFDATTGNLSCTQFTSLSDRNYKEDINDIVNATEVIQQLQGVSFNWKDTGNHAYGVIAQELELIIPEAVTEGMDKKSVDYNMIIAFLIESNKELAARIAVLEGK